MSRFTWEFDHEAIEQARKAMGMKYPVTVRGKRGRIGATAGLYKGIDIWDSEKRGNRDLDEPHHFIAVDRRIPANEASETIWHELAHARQQEDFINKTGDLFAGIAEYNGAYREERIRLCDHKQRVNRKVANRAYRRNRFEVEARDYQQCAEYMPLVKPKKSNQKQSWQSVGKFLYGPSGRHPLSGGH